MTSKRKGTEKSFSLMTLNFLQLIIISWFLVWMFPNLSEFGFNSTGSGYIKNLFYIILRKFWCWVCWAGPGRVLTASDLWYHQHESPDQVYMSTANQQHIVAQLTFLSLCYVRNYCWLSWYHDYQDVITQVRYHYSIWTSMIHTIS